MGYPGEGEDVFVGGEGEEALPEVEHVAHAERRGGEESEEKENEVEPEPLRLV